MASSEISHTRLFGLDLAKWPGQWRAAAALALNWPAFRALTPPAWVALRQLDGRVSTWRLSHGEASLAPDAKATARFQAVELARDEVLERTLSLPALAAADLAEAVRLEVEAATPFPPGQTVAGHRVEAAAPGQVRVDVALTSRQRIENALLRHRQSGGAAGNAGHPPEVWVLPPGSANRGEPSHLRPIVMPGYGEDRRTKAVSQGLRGRVLLLAAVLLLGLALAVTPMLLQRARALQAQRAFDALNAQVAPQLKQREALHQQEARLQSLQGLIGQQLALVPVLGLLTQAVPDSAWLNSLRVEGGKVIASGYADDTAALLQRLGAQPGVKSVRLPTPAVRHNSATKESFTIEMEFDPARYGLTRKGGES